MIRSNNSGATHSLTHWLVSNRMSSSRSSRNTSITVENRHRSSVPLFSVLLAALGVSIKSKFWHSVNGRRMRRVKESSLDGEKKTVSFMFTATSTTDTLPHWSNSLQVHRSQEIALKEEENSMCRENVLAQEKEDAFFLFFTSSPFHNNSLNVLYI